MNCKRNKDVMTLAFAVVSVSEDPDVALKELAQEINDAGGVVTVTLEELREAVSEVSELLSRADELIEEVS